MKSICVFCGSRLGNRPIYREVAATVGQQIAERGLTLVYGGGNVGLMGIVADAALAAQGRVIGVIPEFLKAQEVAHTGLTELKVVSSMHERKTCMAELADAFMALPGGYGTLEEFGEIITWAQLRLHQKPCGLLNVDGYFEPLLQLFDHALNEEFITPHLRQLVITATEPTELLDIFSTYQPMVEQRLRSNIKP
jgi:uncharacterized protein (TIGR00730 family)